MKIEQAGQRVRIRDSVEDQTAGIPGDQMNVNGPRYRARAGSVNALVSVIISNLNGGERLARCLKSLALQEYRNIEVIVVDNDSIDGSPNLVMDAYPGAKLIRSPRNLGFAGGGNLGASLAQGSFLLFLNHDMEFEPGFLHSLTDAMHRHSDVGIAQSQVLKMDDGATIDTIGSLYTSTGFVFHRAWSTNGHHRARGIEEIFGGAGGAILVRRDVFVELGGFDDDFLIYAEDIDLSWRSWLSGNRVVLVPDSIIFHVGGDTTRRLPADFVVYHTFKNRLCTILKNSSWRQLVTTLPIHLILCLLGALLFLAKRKPLGSVAIVRAIAWNARNAWSTLVKRRRVDSLVVVERDSVLSRVSQRMPVRYLFKMGSEYLRKW